MPWAKANTGRLQAEGKGCHTLPRAARQFLYLGLAWLCWAIHFSSTTLKHTFFLKFLKMSDHELLWKHSMFLLLGTCSCSMKGTSTTLCFTTPGIQEGNLLHRMRFCCDCANLTGKPELTCL